MGLSRVPALMLMRADCRGVSNGDLARGLAAGSGWALRETWRRFVPTVHAMATRALGSEAEAEDVAQEVFHRVFREAGTLRYPDSLHRFVLSCTVGALKTELRLKATTRWLSFHEPEALPDAGRTFVDVESRDLLRRFYGLLDRLRPRDRLVFALMHFERMTVEEVATSTELSLSTVKRCLRRATSKLSRRVEADLGLVGLLERKGRRHEI